MRRVVLALLMCLGGLALGSGCGEACATSCSPAPEDAHPPKVLVGKLVARTGNVVRIETDTGPVDVRVTGGHPRVLETGDTYRVPVVEDDETGITYSSLPSDCDCGYDLYITYITEADGDAVDQSDIGFRLNLDDLEQVAFLVLGTFVTVGVLWAGVRRVRDRP